MNLLKNHEIRMIRNREKRFRLRTQKASYVLKNKKVRGFGEAGPPFLIQPDGTSEIRKNERFFQWDY